MSTSADQTENDTADNRELSVLELLAALARRKTLILGLPFLTAVIAAGISLMLPVFFTASVRILPPQQSQSSSTAIVAQLMGGVAGALGAGLKSQSDVYIAMLKSRTLTDSLVQRFELAKVYAIASTSDARAELEKRTNVTSGRDGLITVEVDDLDPARAAELANAYIDELYKLTNVLAVTESSKRRLFYERQLVQAKDNLSNAEITARRSLEQGGVVKVDDQGRAMLSTTARLRSTISQQEVQIEAMRTFASERNPELKLAQSELQAMRNELTRMETGSGNARTVKGDEKGMDGLRLLRDIKYQETLYELLAKQFELAKMDEAREASAIQVLDKAVVPERKSKPKRAVIVLTWAFFALVVAIIWSIVAYLFEKAQSDPLQAGRILEMKRSLGWRTRH